MDDVTKQGALSSKDSRAAAFARAAIAGEAEHAQATPAPAKLAPSNIATGRTDNVPAGIIMMILATIFFAGASAASKWLVAEYPVGEVLFLRSFASFISGAAMILPVTGLSVYATRRPRDHLFRGLSQTISQLALLLAFSLMPLAGAVAINFSAPLFAALVSIVWLKEPAGFVRGAALIVGFVGVVIVTNPGANTLTLGALFALTNAVLYGTVTVAVRGMTRTESPNTLMMWMLTVLAFFHSFLLLFGWRTPSLLDAALLFGTGFVNAVGQWFWTKSLQLVPAPAVTPFYYLMLVWALAFGFLLWGEVPTLSLLIGSGIVVATGLFLFLREARLQQSLAGTRAK
jgi:drug/metabolite transporter (DMT)-like permease